MLGQSRLSIAVPVWLAGQTEAKHWCPGLGLDGNRLNIGVPAGVAYWMKAS